MVQPTIPTAQKVAQMQAAGYEVHQTRAHLGQAWSWRRPGATAGDTFATPELAWTAAVPFFEEEVERTRELMKHMDLKAAALAFFIENGSLIDPDYLSDGGSTWMIDSAFIADELADALIAAPMRDQI